MTPISSTTHDDENGTPQPDAPVTAEDGEDFEEEEDDDEALLDEAPAVVAPVRPSRPRRTVSALVATAAFEVLYLLGVTVIAFATAGFSAVVPTLQSVAISPFVWVPAAVFLVCALVVALPLHGARRAPAVTGLVVAVVVYLGGTFLVLLVAAGSSALSVFVQELSVYPFFLAAIVAREVMVWTRFGHPRPTRKAAAPAVSAPA